MKVSVVGLNFCYLIKSYSFNIWRISSVKFGWIKIVFFYKRRKLLKIEVNVRIYVIVWYIEIFFV